MTNSANRMRAALAIFSLTFLSCQERLVDADVEVEGYTICAIVNGAWVYDDEGEPVSMVHDPSGGHSEVCLCLTPEDAKSGSYDEYFNDQALEVCLADAAAMGYAEANDCAYWHSIEHWKTTIGLWPWNEDERCDLDDDDGTEPSGCSVQR
ncbi:MAG: hypothetical protein HC927_07400 [Deltaproteobacteria bacterium]|nr:hypothetical protein [Deltaproteobacteria bacterium]